MVVQLTSLNVLCVKRVSLIDVHTHRRHHRGLDDNNFAGTIPISIQQLTALRQLSLSYNDFNGTIPAAIGRLTQLDSFTASGTSLSGTIPTTIAQLTKLVSL